MPEPRKPLPRNGPSYQIVGIFFQTRSEPARKSFQFTLSATQPPCRKSASTSAAAGAAGAAAAGTAGSAEAAAPAATPPSTALRVISLMGGVTSFSGGAFQGQGE